MPDLLGTARITSSLCRVIVSQAIDALYSKSKEKLTLLSQFENDAATAKDYKGAAAMKKSFVSSHRFPGMSRHSTARKPFGVNETVCVACLNAGRTT